MNATEMGRRSDSLYYDNVSRRELCDRIAHLESDLEDAKDKNAEVWGSLKAREMKLAFQIDDNAKLRELCAMLYRCASRCLNDLGPSCLCSNEDGCGMDCTVNGEDCCMGLLEQRVRKLRIEVNK